MYEPVPQSELSWRDEVKIWVLVILCPPFGVWYGYRRRYWVSFDPH